MDRSLFPLLLEGRWVRLEPLTLAHVDSLLSAVAEPCPAFSLTEVPADRPAMTRYVESALADAQRGSAVPFATIDKPRARVVGTTRFANIGRWSFPAAVPPPVPLGPDAVEIGWTWLARTAQRTYVNTCAKLLMLTHAFEIWGVRRVALKTDERNTASRANIERIGGHLDGIMRADSPAWDGGVRSSAFYSILPAEWPAARARLEARLAAHAPPPSNSHEPA